MAPHNSLTYIYCFQCTGEKILSQWPHFLSSRASELIYNPWYSDYKCSPTSLCLKPSVSFISACVTEGCIKGSAKAGLRKTEWCFLVYFYFCLLTTCQSIIYNEDINTFLYMASFLAQNTDIFG